MKAETLKSKKILEDGGYTCVIVKGDKVYTSFERGVKPLLDLIDCGEKLEGSSASDKVVGRAAAYLYTLLGVSEVYACTISETATAVFEEYGVTFSYSVLTKTIINRKGDGICPMEDAVKDCSDPNEALCAIRKRLAKLRAVQN